MRIVHFADLHLDAPFARLPPAASRVRRQALRQTLEAILELAVTERADLITCAGDLFEADRLAPDTLAFLHDRLGAAGRPVYIAPGNHDWVGPRTAWGTHTFADNVHVFTEPRLSPVELAPGLLLWGAGHDRPRGTPNLLRPLLASPVDATSTNLALFHGSERESFPFQGHDKEAHAPFEAAEVERAGFLHALVGHFHLPTDAPWHTYPGNPDPLQFGEVGKRAAVVIDVTPQGIKRRRVVVARSEVHDVTVDLDGIGHRGEALDAIIGATTGLCGAVRLMLVGEVAHALDLDVHADLDPDLLGLVPSPDRAVVVESRLIWAIDRARLESEPSVRGEYYRRLKAAPMNEEERERVLHIGLRALAGREDLEVL